MSGSSDRKPLIVLLCLAVLAVAVFVVGAVGASAGPGAGGLPAWARTLSLGRTLTPADLHVAGGTCQIDGSSISVSGACALRVAPVEGGWPWSDVTRRARLVAGDGGVNVAVTVQDQPIDTDLDPGENVRLTFTREGGDLVLRCRVLTGCVVVLAEDSVP